jgi:DnaJ-class molecular chaperone
MAHGDMKGFKEAQARYENMEDPSMSGHDRDACMEECEHCDGEGKINEGVCTTCDGEGELNGQECPTCDGQGEVLEDCSECDGEGEIEIEQDEEEDFDEPDEPDYDDAEADYYYDPY